MTRTLTFLLVAVACCGALTAMPSRAVAVDPVLFAAGDIACDPAAPNFNNGLGSKKSCLQKATSDLMVPGTFHAVLALGDVQYETGALSAFQQSYDRSWGRVKAQTLPVIGNHEGHTPTGGGGYCQYFGAAAHCNANQQEGGAAFYSVNLGTWHIVVLNSNCNAAGGCNPGSRQYEWLKADLAANPRSCTLAAWHHPRWSSGYGGNNAFMQPIWQLLYDNGADVVLAGHSHHYERFAPINGAGRVDPSNGIRSFVVGTGGSNFTPINIPTIGSEVRQATAMGLLRLVLHPTSYDWSFVPVAGMAFADSGSQSCRGPLAQAPPAPSPPGGTSGKPGAGRPGSPVSGRATRRSGVRLALWHLSPARARRAILRGHLRIRARRTAPTVIRVHVAGRLAGRRPTKVTRPVTVWLAKWTKQFRYRYSTVTVTIRRPPPT